MVALVQHLEPCPGTRELWMGSSLVQAGAGKMGETTWFWREGRRRKVLG